MWYNYNTFCCNYRPEYTVNYRTADRSELTGIWKTYKTWVEIAVGPLDVIVLLMSVSFRYCYNLVVTKKQKQFSYKKNGEENSASPEVHLCQILL